MIPSWRMSRPRRVSGLWGYVGAAIVLIAVGILVLVVNSSMPSGPPPPAWCCSRSEEEGIVRISLESVRQLAERTCRGNRSGRRTRCSGEDDQGRTANAMRRWPQHGLRSPRREFGDPEGHERDGRATYRGCRWWKSPYAPITLRAGTGGFSEVSECPNQYWRA